MAIDALLLKTLPLTLATFGEFARIDLRDLSSLNWRTWSHLLLALGIAVLEVLGVQDPIVAGVASVESLDRLAHGP